MRYFLPWNRPTSRRASSPFDSLDPAPSVVARPLPKLSHPQIRAHTDRDDAQRPSRRRRRRRRERHLLHPARERRARPSRRRRDVDARGFRDVRSRPVHTDDTDAPVTTTDAIARLGSTRDHRLRHRTSRYRFDSGRLSRRRDRSRYRYPSRREDVIDGDRRGVESSRVESNRIESNRRMTSGWSECVMMRDDETMDE